jgi:antirestriction protein ArdC
VSPARSSPPSRPAPTSTGCPGTTTDRPSLRPSTSPRKAYRGVNVIALWAAAHAAGFPAGIWGTYRQWQALGAQVRKGERGHLVVFWKTVDRHGKADVQDGDEDRDEPARRMFARGYTVFNCAQVDGYTPPEIPVLPEAERIERAERFCAALGIDIRHGGSQACYRPSTDHVQMPDFACFRDAAAYYAVLLHECGHYAVSRIMPISGA